MVAIASIATAVMTVGAPVTAARPLGNASSSAQQSSRQISSVTVRKYRNCAALQRVYKHGVGRPGARDKVRGKVRPVTTFTVDRAVYLRNRHLDKDRDGIACERR